MIIFPTGSSWAEFEEYGVLRDMEVDSFWGAFWLRYVSSPFVLRSKVWPWWIARFFKTDEPYPRQLATEGSFSDLVMYNRSATCVRCATRSGANALDTVVVYPEQRSGLPVKDSHYLIVLGDGDQYVDEMYPHLFPLSQASGLVTVGFSYRGVGRSTGSVLRPSDLVEDALAVMKTLLQAGVPSEHIHLFGHAEGAWVAAECGLQAQKDETPVATITFDRPFSRALSCEPGSWIAYFLGEEWRLRMPNFKGLRAQKIYLLDHMTDESKGLFCEDATTSVLRMIQAEPKKHAFLRGWSVLTDFFNGLLFSSPDLPLKQMMHTDDVSQQPILEQLGAVFQHRISAVLEDEREAGEQCQDGHQETESTLLGECRDVVAAQKISNGSADSGSHMQTGLFSIWQNTKAMRTGSGTSNHLNAGRTCRAEHNASATGVAHTACGFEIIMAGAPDQITGAAIRDRQGVRLS